MLGVSFRTYTRYERDENHGSKLQRETMKKMIVEAYH